MQFNLILTKLRSGLGLVAIAMLGFSIAGCRRESPEQRNRVVIEYWEKWNGFEADAMRSVIADFNASQDRIFVKFTSISHIDRKLMLATAGGAPPDVAGLWSWILPIYTENNLLMPLDKLAAESGLNQGQYIDVFWEMCQYRGHLWCLPSTPGSIGLVWNKKMFREAGLDPEKPPGSIEELEQFNDKLTRWRPNGTLKTLGHLPEEPGWWDPMWGYWFGGSLWDGNERITANSPENIAAYEWVESYPRRYGASNMLSFREGFGNFASPQNPFFTGRLAMVLQGEWIFNFIEKYAPPGFEWGVAPFPSSDPARLNNVTLVESDVLAIPNGARHPREAFEFIKYVNSQKPMEKLCLLQRKFTPLRECSADFLRTHPNPHIADFIALSKSPNAKYAPRLPTWIEYQSDMRNAVSRIWAGKTTAKKALYDVQQREQEDFDRRQGRWNLISAKLTQEWDQQ